jgi:hypothetical protein
MDATIPVKPPRWFWIVAGVAVAWMLLGVLGWFMDLLADEQTVAGLSDAQRQVYAERPHWVFFLYGVAVFTGLAGAIGLLFRQRWSTMVLGISLAAVIVQFGYLFLATDMLRLLGAGSMVFPLLIFLIGSLLLWLSIHAKKRGW